MTSGGSNFSDFPENQFTKFRGLNSIKANWDHGVPRVILFKAKIFSFHQCEYKQFKH